MSDGQELITRDQSIALTPNEVLENATIQAKLLMNIVKQTKCYQEISGKKYLQVEAWETIGAFNRTHAETKEITPITREDEIIGYAAHVQLWKDGIVVGGAIMPCYFTENCCKGKTGEAKHKACMSAAQTFATSKAYRMNFSYVAILAGFQPTPAEEITEDFATDQTEHWCPIHQTAFFKRGKMTSYAHPVKDEAGEDTGEWCHEPKESNGKSPEPAESKVDMAWLKESLEKINWADVGKWLKGKYGVTGPTVSATVAKLTPQQAGEFVKEVQKRLETASNELFPENE